MITLARLRRYSRPLLALAIVAAAAFLSTGTTFAAGLVQEDIASHPWIIALLGVLGIAPVAVTITAFFDKAAAASGISTSALLWIVCLSLAAAIGLLSGDLPSWTGDPSAFYGELAVLGVKYRVGAEVLHALLMGRLGWVQALRAPKAASRAA